MARGESEDELRRLSFVDHLSARWFVRHRKSCQVRGQPALRESHYPDTLNQSRPSRSARIKASVGVWEAATFISLSHFQSTLKGRDFSNTSTELDARFAVQRDNDLLSLCRPSHQFGKAVLGFSKRKMRIARVSRLSTRFHKYGIPGGFWVHKSWSHKAKQASPN
jgi:hypothetical protein